MVPVSDAAYQSGASGLDQEFTGILGYASVSCTGVWPRDAYMKSQSPSEANHRVATVCNPASGTVSMMVDA